MACDVSVVIPVYNRPKCLTTAVESALSQTVAPDEVIIIDDGSTDSTKNVAVDLESQYRNVVVRRLTMNRGASVARNVGLYYAKNEFVSFLDSDDVWRDAKLEKQLNIIEQNNQLAACSCKFEIFDERTGEGHLGHVAAGVVTFRDICIENRVGTCSAVVVRRSLAVEVGGFDPSLESAQDWDLWMRLCQEANIRVIDYVGVNYRRHKNQISAKGTLRANGHIRLIDKHWSGFEAQGCLEHHIMRAIGRSISMGGLSQVLSGVLYVSVKNESLLGLARHLVALARCGLRKVFGRGQ